MSYVFFNLSDDKLAELETAVREERKKRFLNNNLHKYPKLTTVDGISAVDGTEAYRAAYGISLYSAFTLFNFYHR